MRSPTNEVMEPPDFYPSHVMEPGDFKGSPPSGGSAMAGVHQFWKGPKIVLTYYEDCQELTDEHWQLLLKRAIERDLNK
jgi:hypothetical protein